MSTSIHLFLFVPFLNDYQAEYEILSWPFFSPWHYEDTGLLSPGLYYGLQVVFVNLVGPRLRYSMQQ